MTLAIGHKIQKWYRANPHEMIVLVASSLTALLFLMIAPIYFAPDSEQYFSTAAAIAGKSGGKFYYYRTLGYPFFMLATGVIHFKTLRILLILQALAGAIIPWLVYRTIRHLSPKLALSCALISIVSFSPYFLQNLVMTDQVAMALMYAALLFVVRFVYSLSLTDILLATLCIFLWMLLRPAASLAYVAIVFPLLFLGKVAWRNLAISAMSLLMAFSIYQMITKVVVREYNEKQTNFEKIHWASFSGKMFFWNIYGPGHIYTRTNTISSDNGAYSQEMYNLLVEWGRRNPQGIQSYLKTNDPKEFATRLLTGNDLWLHSILWLSADQMLGPKKADKLFWLVALEGLRNHPKASLLFWDGMVEFLLSGEVEYNSGTRVSWGSGTGFLKEDTKPEDGYFPPVSNIMPNSVVKQIRTSYERTIQLFHHKYFLLPQAMFYWQTFLKIIAVIVCVSFGGALWLVNKQLRIASMVFLMLVLYQAAVCALFASPFFRYIAPVIPVIFMLAACCLAAYDSAKNNQLLKS